MMKMPVVDDDRGLLVRADLTTNQFGCSLANAWVAFNSGTCLHQHFNFQQTIWLKTFNFQQTMQLKMFQFQTKFNFNLEGLSNSLAAFNSGTCLHQHYNFQQTISIKIFHPFKVLARGNLHRHLSSAFQYYFLTQLSNFMFRHHNN